jgi:hypothetical protein
MVRIGKAHRGTCQAVLLTAMLPLPVCRASGAAGTGQASPTATGSPQSLHLVAVGDSIPNNSAQGCPGCLGPKSPRYGRGSQPSCGPSTATTTSSAPTTSTSPRRNNA